MTAGELASLHESREYVVEPTWTMGCYSKEPAFGLFLGRFAGQVLSLAVAHRSFLDLLSFRDVSLRLGHPNVRLLLTRYSRTQFDNRHLPDKDYERWSPLKRTFVGIVSYGVWAGVLLTPAGYAVYSFYRYFDRDLFRRVAGQRFSPRPISSTRNLDSSLRQKELGPANA